MKEEQVGWEPAHRGRGEVLIVEDDHEILTLIRVALELEGFAVDTAETPGEALWAARHRPPSFVVLDLNLPGISGEELAEELRGLCPDDLPIVVMSADAGGDRRAEAIQAAAFVAKPFHLDELIDAAHMAAELAAAV